MEERACRAEGRGGLGGSFPPFANGSITSRNNSLFIAVAEEVAGVVVEEEGIVIKT